MSCGTDDGVFNTVSSTIDGAVVEFAAEAVSCEVVIFEAAVVDWEAGSEIEVKSIRASVIVSACSVDQGISSEAGETDLIGCIEADAGESCLVGCGGGARLEVLVSIRVG